MEWASFLCENGPFHLSLDGNEMMSVQLEWILVCLIFAFLHQRSQTSKTNEHQHHKQRWALFEYGTGPEADTESRVTCYTCVNVSDNLVCNKFAIDRPCPLDKDFCHTLHVMDSRGQSVVVNKKCANSSECSPQRVGCVSIDTQKVCVSCCDEMYCNISVPTNYSTAIYSSTRADRQRNTYDTSRVHQNTASQRFSCGLRRFIPVELTNHWRGAGGMSSEG
uniref:Uncharacterized protein n=1 Tax=Timema poppense TaxID=170557 RepID=A0A7R9H1F4_TIMPO|nr:unnamed protein product [Timema poppensis]